MKTSSHRISVAALVSAAAVLVGATASADSGLSDGFHYSQQSWDGSEGNTDIGNMHTMLNTASSDWTGTWSSSPPTGSSMSMTMFGDFGYLFGEEHQLIYAVASGHGRMRGSSAPYTYSQGADAVFYIHNSQIASPTTSTCEGKGICASINSSISKTIFEGSYPFTVGFVPVTIDVSVQGNLYAGASGMGYGQRFLGKEGYLMGNSASSLSAGAKVSAHLGAEVGWPDVLGVGVTTDFDIIDVSITPHASELVIAYPQHAAVQWNVATPINIRTMNGRVDAYVDTLFGRQDVNIVTWSGASWSQDLWYDANQASFP